MLFGPIGLIKHGHDIDIKSGSQLKESPSPTTLRCPRQARGWIFFRHAGHSGEHHGRLVHCPLVEVNPRKGTRDQADSIVHNYEGGESVKDIAYNFSIQESAVREPLAYAAARIATRH